MKDSYPEASFAGNLLIASSLVRDPMYAGGVCLIVHQDEENVVGVMLNRPMQPNPAALKTLLEKKGQPSEEFNRLPPTTSHSEVPGKAEELPDLGLIHFGGPLSGPVVALHQESQFAEAEAGVGIYMAAQKDHLEDLLKQRPSSCRLIVGHLGWTLDQFEREIEAGFWHLVPATAEAVFASPGDIWPGLIRRATSRSVARWIGTPDVINAAELN